MEFDGIIDGFTIEAADDPDTVRVDDFELQASEDPPPKPQITSHDAEEHTPTTAPEPEADPPSEPPQSIDVDDESDEILCAVCFDPGIVSELRYPCKCVTGFHYHCFQRLIQSDPKWRKECPTCRSTFVRLPLELRVFMNSLPDSDILHADSQVCCATLFNAVLCERKRSDTELA